MKKNTQDIAALSQPATREIELSGAWTARGVGRVERQLKTVSVPAGTSTLVECAEVSALDTAGAWLLQRLLLRIRNGGGSAEVKDLQPTFARLLDVVTQQSAAQARLPEPPPAPNPGLLERAGRQAAAVWEEVVALLAFLGESGAALVACIAHPARLRWRPILYNITSAGLNALPIIGLLSFMLGVVVAYQGAGQLRQYGANIFVADLVGLSVLREFAPLVTAIVIAGRSGSAYAAQIGTMAVTEEIDAMRTLGIKPFELLVLPKFIGLLIALPLLTVAADLVGVAGGMVMAQTQLGVGYGEFGDRFLKAVTVTDYLIGVGKAPCITPASSPSSAASRASVLRAARRAWQPHHACRGADDIPRHPGRWPVLRALQRAGAVTMQVTQSTAEPVIQMQGVRTQFGEHVVHDGPRPSKSVAPKSSRWWVAAVQASPRCCAR